MSDRGNAWLEVPVDEGAEGIPDALPPEPRGAEGRDLPLDAHLHTDLSPDSDVPIDAYAQLALERRIDEIAITDHVDFDPQDPAYGPSFEVRERIVRDAAERWADRVTIRFGVEITWESRYAEEIRDHLRRHRYDYVIGSVHVGWRSPYRGPTGDAVTGRTMAEAVGPYFDEVARAARSGLFDTIGHLDYVKKYVHPHLLPKDFAAAPELYEPLLVALVEHGVALEVNTSGLRQAPREPYPAQWVVERYRALGGERLTAGSDAHRTAWFAYGLGAAYRTAAGSGFDHLSFRRGGPGVHVAVPDRFRDALAPNESGVSSL